MAEELRLQTGDRVVFLGDSLVEQAQYNGWLEVALTTSFPDQDVTFRNLGWSGDTPAGKSRFGLSLLQAGREPADEGWKQLQKQLQLTRPTVLILGYGMASSLEGGLEELTAFEDSYRRLLDYATQLSPEVRLVFLSPISHTDASERRSMSLNAYSDAIQKIASERRDSIFVDLREVANGPEFRQDSIHLNEAGYREVAIALARECKLPRSKWESSPHTEPLRQVILRKNQWWFHRSRPANMAYVFGFRKREQGQNAIEIPQFDSLIAADEQRIAALRTLETATVSPGKTTKESKFAEFTEQAVPEFTISDDWEVTLWAQNPLLNKPIHMNFDPQGRLWIASSEAYPMIEVGQSAPDRIIVLEDSTGDGKADKSSIFAEGLLIPTGIAPGNGGVYVAQSTDLLFLQDKDGDGTADHKTRVLSGFGTEDTHHNLHSLRWGPDGRLYMNQSVYTRSDLETPHGIVRLKAGGGFRMDTRTLQTEVFFRGLWNSWGHQFDRFGQSFLSDGAGFDGLGYSFPGATFNPTPNARRTLKLISPGRWPKFASLEIIEGPSYPTDWQGTLITCDFRANRVTRFSLSEQDAGFATQQQDDLLRTSAATFRPIDVKQGPDGALYIADWSNPIINHGEVDFRDPRRDRWHGRIWRVRWKGAPEKSKRDLTQLSDQDLLALLETDDRYDRDQARRVLIERGDRAWPALSAWAKGLDAGSHAQLEATWLSYAIQRISETQLRQLLASKNTGVRAAGVRLLGSAADPQLVPSPQVDSDLAYSLLEKAVRDKHPRVRLEAIRSAARVGGTQAVELALRALDLPMDDFLEHALHLTVNDLAPVVQRALVEGLWRDPDDARKLEFAITALPPKMASEYLKNRLATQSISTDGSGPWIELIGQIGGPDELNLLFTHATMGTLEQPALVRALQALAEAQRLRRVQPTSDLSGLSRLLLSDDQSTVRAALDLTSAWRLRSAVPIVADLAKDATRELRVPAIRALANLGGKPAIGELRELAKNSSDGIRREAIRGLAQMDVSAAIESALEFMATVESEQELLGLWRGLLEVRGLGKKLASRLANAELTEQSIATGIRATRDGGRQEPELQAILQSKTKMKAIEYTAEFMRELASEVGQGDPYRGELIYRRNELACVTCHAIGGIGGKVGPDMTSLGASAPVDYLVESLFAPNAKIKENYHAVKVLTEDDRILTGIEQEETEEELVLRTAEDKLIRIPIAEILSKQAAQSLMPVGVVDKLGRQEQLDLLAFLSRLGKPGDFDASQGGVAREFEIFAGTHRREQQGAEKIIQGDITAGWNRLETRVNGNVARSTIEALTKQPINIALVHVYLRCRVEKSVGGISEFRVPGKAACWIDGVPAEGIIQGRESQFQAKLTPGAHTIVLRLDARDLPEQFRLSSPDAVFLARQP